MPREEVRARPDELLSGWSEATEAQRYALLRSLQPLLNDPAYLLACWDEAGLARCMQAFRSRGGVGAKDMAERLHGQRANIRRVRRTLASFQDVFIPLDRIVFKCRTTSGSLYRTGGYDLPAGAGPVFQAERERQSRLGWEGLFPLISRLFDALPEKQAAPIRPLVEALAWSLQDNDSEAVWLWGLFVSGNRGVAERIRLSVFEEGTGDIALISTRSSETEEGKRFETSIRRARWAAAGYLRRLSVDFDAPSLLSSDILLRVGDRYHPPGVEGVSLGLPIAILLIAEALRLDPPRHTALTGQITAEGQVYAVEGVPEKAKAGAVVGVTRLIVSADNLQDGPWPDGLTVYGVRTLEEVCERIFGDVLLKRGYRAYPLGATGNLDLGEPEPPLVGRKHHLVGIKQRLNRVLSGYGGLVVLKGEAGIGKSRLLTEIRRHAETSGMKTLFGRCSSQQNPIPYLPLIEALTETIPPSSPPDRAQHTTALRETLERIRQTGIVDSTQLRELKVRLYDQVVALLTDQAHFQGLLLAIEDVHWSDTGTIDLLYHITRYIRQKRLCLIVTLRTEEETLRTSTEGRYLTETLQRCMTEGLSETVELIGLDVTECETLIAAQLGARHVPMWLTEWMYRQTQGNPLFVVETVRWWQDQGWLRNKKLEWKDLETGMGRAAPRIQELIERRLNHLETQDKEILEIAAIGGERFDAEDLIEICETGRLPILRAIHRLDLDHGLLRHIEGAVYGFSHAQIRETLYDRMSAALRKEYHAEWGALGLNRRAAGREVDAETLALYLYEGREPHEAVPYLMESAEPAMQMFTFREARRNWERAETLMQEQRHSDEARFKIMIGLSRVCYEMGDWETAESFNRRALALAEQIGDIASQARARLQLGAIMSGRNLWDNAIQVLKQSIEMYTQIDGQVGIANNYSYLGHIAYWTGQWEQAHDYYHKAYEIFTDLKDEERLVKVVSNLGLFFLLR
ncbi:MAG: AAA family ATPase [candidate division Zixibacteria bacterium]|nr:AAA family ATPase [candidate division Zixibacteria bacterium]